MKLARGHAAYELYPKLQEPTKVSFAPLQLLSDEERWSFEQLTAGKIDLWPEIGSRAFLRAFGKSPDRLPVSDGCIGTQTTFPFGTPREMHRAVNNLAEALDAGGGGLMLPPTHVLEPEVPPENIEAFFEACDGLRYATDRVVPP